MCGQLSEQDFDHNVKVGFGIFYIVIYFISLGMAVKLIPSYSWIQILIGFFWPIELLFIFGYWIGDFISHLL